MSAAEQVVRRLQRLHRAGLVEGGELVGVVVGHPDVPELALVDELLQRGGGLLGRGLGVRPVHLVEVDVVDAQRAQAASTPLRSQSRRASRGGRCRVDAALVADDQRVTVAVQLAAQCLAEHLLGPAEAVRLGGVEDVHPELARVPDGPDRRVLVERAPVAAELPGAEGHPGDVKAAPAQHDVPHTATPSLDTVGVESRELVMSG